MRVALIAAVAIAVAAIFKWIQYRVATTALIHMMLSKGMEVNEREVKIYMEECIRRGFKALFSRKSRSGF